MAFPINQPYSYALDSNSCLNMSGMSSDPCYQSATILGNRIRSRDLSTVEVLQAFLEHIDSVNKAVNAICTLVPEEEVLAQAAAIDKALDRGENPGPLAGLPIAIKDLVQTRGIRTTMGSPIFRDQVPKTDALMVERIRNAGAVIIGKTNTPEFGAGSNTFNPVFGVTRNPYNLGKVAGGSSGGAAAALASRMLPIADGSDLGGSLRNPAAFCNVIGFRPSIGRIPIVPTAMGWQSRLSVEGPMARTVDDCALLLSVQAGPDQRDPISLPDLPALAGNLKPALPGKIIGWSENLQHLPMAPAITRTFNAAAAHFHAIGCEVRETDLDLSDAMDVFRVLRGNQFAEISKSFFDDNQHQIKQTVIDNVTYGRSLTGDDLSRADVQRTRIYLRMLDFFETHDFLVVPTTQVEPFDIDTEWVAEINGHEMSDYLEWMSVCCVITPTGLPSISMPCGFSDAGLPVGLQIVGPPGADLEVLQMAKAFEAATHYADQLPAVLNESPLDES